VGFHLAMRKTRSCSMTLFPTNRPARVHPTVCEWSVRDFKALEYASLPLAHLNVLVGANSSGKSSFIQSLLLLAQSTEDEIILNGPYVWLGEPADVIRGGYASLGLGYVVRFSGHGDDEPISEMAFDVTLSAQSGTLQMSKFSAVEDGRVSFSATAERVSSKTRELVNKAGRFGDALLRVREIDGRHAPAWTFLACRGLYPDALIYRRTPKQVLADLRKNYRSSLLEEDPDRAFELSLDLIHWMRRDENIREIPETSRRWAGSTKGGFTHFLGMAPSDLDALFVAYAGSLPAEEWVPIAVGHYSPQFQRRLTGIHRSSTGPVATDQRLATSTRTLSSAVDALRNFRESIRYLGPLREEPQVVSPTGGRYRSLPAGPKGEYTADLLARAKNDTVSFTDWERKPQVARVPDAVSLWTTYLGVGEQVAVEDQGKLGRGLRIKVNGIERDLTMIGVGASQVIPVLTVVLAAESASIVLLEQPELHLHPAVQSRLADFLLWARPDLRIVVETHSEYLVTRLRRRTAEGLVSPDQIAVLFAEQEGGRSEFRHIRLNELGDFSEWPKGFFDTQDEDSRALVRAVRAGIQSKQLS
jgi:predicted ATPase